MLFGLSRYGAFSKLTRATYGSERGMLFIIIASYFCGRCCRLHCTRFLFVGYSSFLFHSLQVHCNGIRNEQTYEYTICISLFVAVSDFLSQIIPFVNSAEGHYCLVCICLRLRMFVASIFASNIYIFCSGISAYATCM